RRLYDVNYQFGWLGENPPGSDLPERPKRMEYCRYKEEAKTGGRKQPEQSLLVSQEWVQLVVTHDNYEVRFYANGRLFDIQPYVTNKPVVIADLVIGAMPEELNNDFYYCRFNGVIDEVAIFRRILSEEEIRQMYEAGKPF
ncbi:MAG: LamG domain-containing protein, partial [Sedimentisphaerales bacterium]|nr:LamG domain-containing protein [Sedimentisphaerales bacterium]